MKKIVSVLILITMLSTLLPASVLAADVPQVIFTEVLGTMQVGESKQLSFTATGGTPSFTVTPKASATIDDTGLITALKAGRVEVKATINGNYAGQCIIMVKDDQASSAPKINKSAWPFVPSTENTTNGKIQSGWYTIYSHDKGLLSISDSGIVSPSRRFQDPFYIEHLGNDVYYIYEAYGKYLSYQGKPTLGAQIIVSKTPCKWQAEEFYDWEKKYIFSVYENPDYSIIVYGLCSETEDSMTKLTYMPMLSEPKNYFTLDAQVPEQVIPQWYKDFMAGESAPTDGKEKPKVFGSVPVGLKNTTQEEWDVLRLTNIERTKAGLPLLVTFDALQKAGGVRADELENKYDHTRPNGSAPNTALSEQGVAYGKSAENIAQGQSSAEAVVQDWMNSPGHKANILTPSLRYMGTGFSQGSKSNWVQLFAESSGSDCASMTYNEDLGYFILTLKNGITAYAPYDSASSPPKDGKVSFNYPGAGTTETQAPEAMADGWYTLSTMDNFVNLTSNGLAELRKLPTNQGYYVENKGNGQITLKLPDGRYLGLTSTIKNGAQLQAVDSPYLFQCYKADAADLFSLRPVADTKMLVNATSEKSANGTKIIVWIHENLNAPKHALFRFTPGSGTTGSATAPVTPGGKQSFTDVAAGSYYENAVLWAVKKGVTAGTSETNFSPETSCTRAQVVTFLWRATGSPIPPFPDENPFIDVKPSDYYYKAVLWASQRKITTGISNTSFDPNGTCTSAQVISFLWRANDEPAASATSTLATTYPNQYYTDAVAWADSTGLLSGMGAVFAPNNKATRADIVTYLYRDAGSPAIEK